MKLLRYGLSAMVLLCALVYLGYITIVQFAYPHWTQTQLLLNTWHGLIPLVIVGIALAITEWIYKSK